MLHVYIFYVFAEEVQAVCSATHLELCAISFALSYDWNFGNAAADALDPI